MDEQPFPRVNLTEDEVDFINHLVDTFAESMPELHWYLPFVEKYRAIPLYAGWTETMALTSRGEFVRWSTEGEYDGLRPVDDKLYLRCSMMQGVKRYPKLQSLIPSRPLNAITCDDCNGTGILPIPLYNRVICKCGGVGWLDP